MNIYFDFSIQLMGINGNAANIIQNTSTTLKLRYSWNDIQILLYEWDFFHKAHARIKQLTTFRFATNLAVYH